MINRNINDSTPIAMLTVGQLKEVMALILTSGDHTPTPKSDRRYEYGLRGIGKIFNCSIPTAQRLKGSGAIDAAITQIGRKIVVDADLAIELAGRKIKST